MCVSHLPEHEILARIDCLASIPFLSMRPFKSATLACDVHNSLKGTESPSIRDHRVSVSFCWGIEQAELSQEAWKNLRDSASQHVTCTKVLPPGFPTSQGFLALSQMT